MNILVINGSPKGKDSVTLQTVNYLKLRFVGHNFDVIHAGQQIKKYEREPASFTKQLEAAELIIFCYPVYTFLAPCQLHRFIELMEQSGVDLSGKYAAQISTSKHFYDVTAAAFIKESCDDMGLKYIDGLLADMEDLTGEKGRRQAVDFFKYILWSANNGYHQPQGAYRGGHTPVIAEDAPAVGKRAKTVAIVTDMTEGDDSLRAMLRRFEAVLPYNSRVVNISEFPIKGGCLGCFNCAADGKCVYKDGFESLLRNEIQSCDAIVYAFSIKHHSMGSRFKMYDDRQFCNGHRTVTMGMPVGYLVSGPYSRENNLRVVVEARAQVGGNFLAGVATDEYDVNMQIDKLASTLEYALENNYSTAQNFYGVGGMKIFRDLIYQMQGLMRADHKFYKQHGQYDFPQKHKGKVLAMYLVGSMIKNKKIKAKIGSKMTEGMLLPYNKVLNDAKNEPKIVTGTQPEHETAAR